MQEAESRWEEGGFGEASPAGLGDERLRLLRRPPFQPFSLRQFVDVHNEEQPEQAYSQAERELYALRLSELEDLCHERGLEATGSKVDLVQRLAEHQVLREPVPVQESPESRFKEAGRHLKKEIL